MRAPPGALVSPMPRTPTPPSVLINFLAVRIAHSAFTPGPAARLDIALQFDAIRIAGDPGAALADRLVHARRTLLLSLSQRADGLLWDEGDALVLTARMGFDDPYLLERRLASRPHDVLAQGRPDQGGALARDVRVLVRPSAGPSDTLEL